MLKFIWTISVLSSFLTYSQCSVTTNSVDASCYGECDGFIQAVGVGAAPLDFSWSSGDTTAILANACAGTYILTMTDDTACVAYDTVVISEPEELMITLSVYSSPSDSGICDAIILSDMTGGVPPYTYTEWFDCQDNISLGSILAQPSTPDEYYFICPGGYALIGYDSNQCIDTSNCILVNNPVASINEEVVKNKLIISGRMLKFKHPVNQLKFFHLNGYQICLNQISTLEYELCDKVISGLYILTFESADGHRHYKKYFFEG